MLLLMVVCGEFLVSTSLVPGHDNLYVVSLFFSDPLGKEGKRHSQLKFPASTINGLNVPRTNLSTWEIYDFSGKMHSMSHMP